MSTYRVSLVFKYSPSLVACHSVFTVIGGYKWQSWGASTIGLLGKKKSSTSANVCFEFKFCLIARFDTRSDWQSFRALFLYVIVVNYFDQITVC